MGRVALVILLWCLIECGGWTQTHANWHSTSKENQVDNWHTNIVGSKRKKETVTRLYFYLHDTLSRNKPSTARIAQAPTTGSSPTMFGGLWMADNPLTKGPEPTSPQLGRAQGMYGTPGQQVLSFMIIRTFVLTSGIYNGSSLSILGWNAAAERIRENPIVGGTGAFRLARGFVNYRTYSFNATTFNSVQEFNLTVIN